MCEQHTELGEVIQSGGSARKGEDKLQKAEASGIALSGGKALLIRIRCGRHAMENVDALVDLGVGGVMLTAGFEEGASSSPSTRVLSTHAAIKAKHPALWVGLNFVGYSWYDVAKLLLKVEGGIDGVWVDNSYVKEGSAPQSVPEMVLDKLSKIPSFGASSLYFGGVYHKGGHAPPDAAVSWFAEPDAALEPTTTNALVYMDVVCTSGLDTGIPIAVDKVRRMHAVTGGKIKLAVASGVTRDNIDELLPFVDLFIVGTSVHDEDERLLSAEVAALNNAFI